MKRRQFILSMMAGVTAASVFVSLEKRTLAYSTPSQLLYGVRANNGKIQLFSLDLNTLEVQDLSFNIPDISLLSNERISSFTVLLDGTLVVVTAPVTTLQLNNPSRLISLSPSITLPTLQLDLPSTVESLCATNDGKLLSIISLNQGVPPFYLAEIDLETGSVNSLNDQLALPGNARFSNLTESPDSLRYAGYLAPGQSSTTAIVQLDLNARSFTTQSQLSYASRPLSNDILGQAYSPSNDGSFVLANPTYQDSNSLFWVNLNGVMQLITAFAVDKIAFARAITPTTPTSPTLPTSEDQCKNDGWKAFGFNNQGECIKFVNTCK